MATHTMYPDGDGTMTGTVLGTPSPPPYYTNIDEGTTSPNDSDVLFLSSNPCSVIVTLSNTPSDVDTVTGVTIRIRTANNSKGRTVASCQLFQSDETTALTALANISGSTTTTTYSLSPSITGATTKTAWDGARLKVNAGGSGGSANLYAVQVDITYSTAGGGVNKATLFYQHNQQNNSIGG